MFPALPALGEDDDGADWQEAGEDGGPAVPPAAAAPPSAVVGIVVSEPDNMSPRDQRQPSAGAGGSPGRAASKPRAGVPPLPSLSLLGLRKSTKNISAAATAALVPPKPLQQLGSGGGGDDAAVRDSKMQRWRDELLAELESKRQEHRASVAGSMAAGRG